MADGITLNSGSGGSVINTDDIAGTHTQIVKLGYGALDSLTIVSTSAGLPVAQQGAWVLGANSGVDIGDVDVTSIVPGTGATNLGKAEDAAHSSGDVGIMGLGVRRNTAVASSGSDADYEPLQMTGDGFLRTSVGGAVGGAALTNTSASASNVTIQAANNARRGWQVHNDSTSVAYVKFGATASSTSYTVRLEPNAFYEMPQPCYLGIIDAIWVAANGSARTTELT